MTWIVETRILRPAANYIDAVHELSRCFSPFLHSRRTSARRKMHRKENYISLFLFLKEKFHIQVFFNVNMYIFLK